MERLLYVTAIYDLYSHSSGGIPQGSGSTAIIERLLLLQQHLPADLLVFAQPNLVDDLAAVGAAGGRVEPLELAATETARLLEGASLLPPCRSETKDTKLYHCLMCAKTEFLLRAKALEPLRPGFVWIDAGITKILKDAAALPGILERAAEQAQRVARAHPDSIVIPGCWPLPQYWLQPERWPFFQSTAAALHLPPSEDPATPSVERYALSVLWRFCGGFAIVPSALVERFAAAVLDGIARVLAATGCSVWEVNIWALVERELPVKWYYGEHNATIFDCEKVLAAAA
jgi:hypothetical protein